MFATKLKGLSWAAPELFVLRKAVLHHSLIATLKELNAKLAVCRDYLGFQFTVESVIAKFAYEDDLRQLLE